MIHGEYMMTEMGIQMELKRRDSGLMHRAITRKPRVDISAKPTRYSSRNSEDSRMDDSESEELENVNIDVCLSIEDVKYSQRARPKKQSKKFQGRNKCDERMDSATTNPCESGEHTGILEIMNESSHTAQPQTHNKNTQSRPNKKKTGLVRAMSVDNVLHRRRPTRDPSFLCQPKPSDQNVQYPDYDVGSQIMESYSEKLQYSTGTPRLSTGKRVKSFFRRLAGSLESLLGIKRKSETASEPQEFMMPNPPVSSMSNQAFYTPFVFPKERQSTEFVATFEATMSSQSYDRDNATVGVNSTEMQQNVSKSNVAFHRGGRIYTPRDTMETSMASALITPTPPRKPATKRIRGLRKRKFRGRQYVRRGSSMEFSDISNDWETRSDTDSEGYAFQSNKLTMMNNSLQSNLDDDELQNSNSSLRLQECQLTTTKEIETKRSIPVKISEFRPPGNSIRQMRSKENNRTKGPMKALRPTEEISMPRSESTGKFDTSKRQVKRKIRRRNSSFVPTKDDQLHLHADVASKQTEGLSFEKIMSEINQLADSLDKVNMSSSRKLNDEEINRPNELKALKAAKETTPQTQKSSQLTRNQSWVGKVSHRLDNLIEAKDGASKSANSRKANGRPVRSKPPTPKTNRKRAPGKEIKQSIIVKEKVSFDELESDFRNFARQVRERKISTERVNTVGT